MNKKLGIPYMGGKKGIAENIVDFIRFENPNAKYFYDLFGGGGAISFQALNSFENVYYNELNTGVVKLLEKIRDDGVTDEFYKWVDRETFKNHKNDDTWYGGLLATCWSFGNNKEKGYLFGKNIEENKRLLHEIIVNRCDVSRKQFEAITGLYIDDKYLFKDNINDRRLEVMRVVKSSLGRTDMQQLQRLERLQQLEQLEQLQRLNISNKSAFDVEITTPINETVIYLDPPYLNTAKYQEDICHNELMEYIKSSPYKIYVSSYEFDLPVVLEMSKRCTMSAIVNNKVVERLYCNE